MSRVVGSSLVVAALMLTACGRTLGTEDFATDQPTGHYSPGATERAAPGTSAPPPLTLHRPEGDVDLEAWTYCFSNPDSGSAGCADGGPPEDQAATSAAGEVAFSFPLEGWAFTADFVLTGDDGYCRNALTTAVEQQDDGTYVVPALGPAGTWDVMITGYGDTGNDLATSFRWTTSADSDHPTPATGNVGFMGPPMSRDEAPIAFGPSLLLSGLVPEPASASADLVLPDAAGAPSYPMELQPDRCHHDGVLSLAASGEPGAEVDLPDLGEPPYRTEVHLTMDGASYVGVGSWPDDLQPRSSNQLVLEWTPPLPEPVG
jgi:hypothetical protein